MQAAAYGLIAVVCVFIAGHAWGWGPMAWLIISEVSPLEVRSRSAGGIEEKGGGRQAAHVCFTAASRQRGRLLPPVAECAAASALRSRRGRLVGS